LYFAFALIKARVFILVTARTLTVSILVTVRSLIVSILVTVRTLTVSILVTVQSLDVFILATVLTLTNVFLLAVTALVVVISGGFVARSIACVTAVSDGVSCVCAAMQALSQADPTQWTSGE
jgi:hypothetical protein